MTDSSRARVERVSDAIPDPEPLHRAHATYAKAELSSIGELVSDISDDLSTLIRQELTLARAELKESATAAGKGAGMVGGAAVAGHLALLFASLTLAWLLAQWWDSLGWAAFAVTVLWAVIAAVLAARGRRQFGQVKGIPRTIDTAKKVPEALKGNEDQL